MNGLELTGRTALVTGVTRRAGIGAAIARELGRAGARLFVTFFRHYDRKQVWGVEPNEPESLLSELRSIADDVAATEMDLSQPALPAELFRQAPEALTVSQVGSHAGYEQSRTHWSDGSRDWCHKARRDWGGDCARTWTSRSKTLCDILPPLRPPTSLGRRTKRTGVVAQRASFHRR